MGLRFSLLFPELSFPLVLFVSLDEECSFLSLSFLALCVLLLVVPDPTSLEDERVFDFFFDPLALLFVRLVSRVGDFSLVGDLLCFFRRVVVGDDSPLNPSVDENTSSVKKPSLSTKRLLPLSFALLLSNVVQPFESVIPQSISVFVFLMLRPELPPVFRLPLLISLLLPEFFVPEADAVGGGFDFSVVYLLFALLVLPPSALLLLLDLLLCTDFVGDVT